jgi:hypothetical protein
MFSTAIILNKMKEEKAEECERKENELDFKLREYKRSFVCYKILAIINQLFKLLVPLKIQKSLLTQFLTLIYDYSISKTPQHHQTMVIRLMCGNPKIFTSFQFFFVTVILKLCK